MKTGEIKVIELLFVNVFLIKTEEGYILIDSGIPMAWKMLETALSEEGVVPGNLKLIIITHGDFDHIGNCKKLQEQYHCKIAIHQADVPMAVEGFMPKRKKKSFRAKFFSLLRRHVQIETFTPDIILADGQALDEYGWDAKVIHIPGHTKGSIGLLTKDGTFLAGDIFTNRSKPDTATYIENAKELLASQLRIKALPIGTVYPGHGKPFDFALIKGRLIIDN